MKREKGITLIALIITVIVLLILAGVSIAAITSSGIFEKAKSAVNEYEKAGKNEQERLNEYLEMINNNANTTTEPEEKRATISEGFYYVGGNEATGLVISDAAEDENKGEDSNTLIGNEFVWVPVPDIDEMVWEADKRGKLYNFQAGQGSTVRADSQTSTTTGYREPSYLTSTNVSRVNLEKETQLGTVLPMQFE